MIWVGFCVRFAIYIYLSFLHPFSSKIFSIENFVFFLCRKNQFLSQTKSLCLSLRKSSVQRSIFQNPRVTKKQKRKKHLKKTLEKWNSVYILIILVVQKKPLMHSNFIWYTANLFEPWLDERNHITWNKRFYDHE